MATLADENIEESLQTGDRVRIEGIDWDTDGDDPTDLDLPLDTEITIPEDWVQGESVADILSDRYGFCIHGITTIKRI